MPGRGAPPGGADGARRRGGELWARAPRARRRCRCTEIVRMLEADAGVVVGDDRLERARRALRDARRRAARPTTAIRPTASPTARRCSTTTSGSCGAATRRSSSTGFDPDVGRRRGGRCLMEPADAMAALGVEPESISRSCSPTSTTTTRATSPLSRRRADHRGGRARLLARPAGPARPVRPAVEASEMRPVQAAVAAGRVRRADGTEEIAEA